MSERLGTARWEDQSVVSQKYPFIEGTFWLGRSENGTSIGYRDDRHICLVSGSRGGKGTSVIVNNLCFWPGSAIVVDPKGENATVTAARRGRGSEHCVGLGQAVHVLDPFKSAVVEDHYRSSFNPLDALDPMRDETIDEATRLANAIVVVKDESADPFWDESARTMLRGIILHVLTAPEFTDDERNLVTVRQLISRGEWRVAKAIGRELQKDWEKHARISRLPLPTDEGVTIKQRWEENRVVEMLQNSPPNEEIRIVVSFFVTDVDLFPLLSRLLTNSTRKITIMMLDPDAPVLEMRYGTETKPIRETLTAASARTKILSQLQDLAGVQKSLKRGADDAKHDSPQQARGTLEVRTYQCAPTLVSYATQNETFVGMLLLHESANVGPMIHVKKGEPMWDLIEANWKTFVRVSKERILPGDAPAPPAVG